MPEDEIGSALDDALEANLRPRAAPAPAASPPADPLPGAPATAAAPAPAPAPVAAEASANPVAQWFLGIDDQQAGPFTAEEVREKVASGKANRDTLCWKAGQLDWMELSRLPEFAAAVAQPAAAPVPAANFSSAVSLSSLVKGELKVLARTKPREESSPEEPEPRRPQPAHAGPLLDKIDAPPEEAPAAEQSLSSYRPMEYSAPRPAPPAIPAWKSETPKAVTYALVGGVAVILLLASAVLYLMLRAPPSTPAGDPPVVVQEVDAGPASVAVLPKVEPVVVVAQVVDAGPPEPTLSPEEFAKLPKSLSPQEIMKVVVADRTALGECVEAQQEEDPDLSGKLVMRWKILPSGRTRDVEVVSKVFERSTISSCVSARIQTWNFPPHQEQGPPVDFPFKF